MQRNTNPPPTYARPPTPKAAPKAKNNCLNIGRDDIALGLFTHMARPPVTSPGQYENQRRFGGDYVIANRPTGSQGMTTITMFRNARVDVAALEIEMRSFGMFVSEASVTLTAEELQTLACALIDAAHDLRTYPASSYKPGGAE